MQQKPAAERVFERVLFASRWLMAPMYLGLVAALVGMVIVYVQELVHYAAKLLTMTGEEAILAGLTLIDVTLAANLVLIVMFSGYENFVSKFDIGAAEDRPDWMGKVDFQGLKIKLIASIVAISGIALLKRFMEIGEPGFDNPAQETQLYWMVIIHLTFVISGALLAAMDWLLARTGKH